MLPQHFSADFYTDSSQYVNPGYSEQFSQNPEQGPSASTSHSPPPHSRKDSEPSPRKKQQRAPRPKRKRGGSVADDNADNSPGSGSGDAQGSQRTVPKKKKANRACFHCQKAHLTCDDCACLSCSSGEYLELILALLKRARANVASNAASRTNVLRGSERRQNIF